MGRKLPGLCSDLLSHPEMHSEASERRVACFPEHTSWKSRQQGQKMEQVKLPVKGQKGQCVIQQIAGTKGSVHFDVYLS